VDARLRVDGLRLPLPGRCRPGRRRRRGGRAGRARLRPDLGRRHDTRGRAIDNAAAGLQLGITTFDASASGLGGCPFAPGAPGNLATETLVSWLHGLGIETGVDEPALLEASAYIRSQLS
jgi:hydroxymethylglutaryl-CoA lyase